MADQDKPQYLRLVAEAPKTRRRGTSRKPQLEMFLSRETNLLALFLLAPSKMRLFAKAIDATRPRYVFDLRVLPAFDGAGTSRRSIFRLMESAGCTYIDAMGLMGGIDRRSALLQSGEFGECVRSACGPKLVGPIFFLFQSGEELVWSCSVLPKVLQPAPRRGWSMHVLGTGNAAGERASSSIEAEDFMHTVQPWNVGEILYVVASSSESTGWLLDEGGRPTAPVSLKRGSAVRVVALQIGQWTDVEVLAGPHHGHAVRLASNTNVARVIK